jgi:HEAT repeat protein
MQKRSTRRLILYGVGILLAFFLILVAVLSLPIFHSTSFVDTLITALEHKDVNIRHSAISKLRKLGPQAELAIPALTRLLQDEDAGVRYRAADTLGSLGTLANEASISLINAVRDEDDRVRRSAAIAISSVAPTAHTDVPDLIKFLKNRNPNVRIWAADALVALASDGVDANEAIPQLKQCLNDENRDIRMRAISAITSLDEPDASCVPALLEAFKSGEKIRVFGPLALLGQSVQLPSQRSLFWLKSSSLKVTGKYAWPR